LTCAGVYVVVFSLHALGDEMSVVLMIILVGAVTTVVGLLGFYLLCAYVVWATGGTSGLRDLAVAVRAFFYRHEGGHRRGDLGGRR